MNFKQAIAMILSYLRWTVENSSMNAKRFIRFGEDGNGVI